ncbi:MBL fold metallo-hydrolase [Dokdonella sp.]|uniref:MBL fold metallo-hydrolase n=1 Tax=Dokdonella sp. TaxID=2291710 RepID=UPI003527A88F
MKTVSESGMTDDFAADANAAYWDVASRRHSRMRLCRATATLLAFLLAPVALANTKQDATPPSRCAVEILVLGIAQDAGIPQIGQRSDSAWDDHANLRPEYARLATSLALLDHRSGKRYLFEATPDLRQQLQRLDLHAAGTTAGLAIDGIFLTHAHIGHYAGLMFLGHESAGASGVPVHAMPRMLAFLKNNGPWQQLASFGNITLRPMQDNVAVSLGEALRVIPHRVPHRDEYSETVGFSIEGPGAAVLFIPDIDSWARWQDEYGQSIEDQILRHDVAYLDATFYDDNELPGRDMSAIPHPRIAAMMEQFDALPSEQRSKVRFIHLNHSNPARYADSAASKAIRKRGYRVAREGESTCLAAAPAPLHPES